MLIKKKKLALQKSTLEREKAYNMKAVVLGYLRLQTQLRFEKYLRVIIHGVGLVDSPGARASSPAAASNSKALVMAWCLWLPLSLLL